MPCRCPWTLATAPPWPGPGRGSPRPSAASTWRCSTPAPANTWRPAASTSTWWSGSSPPISWVPSTASTPPCRCCAGPEPRAGDRLGGHTATVDVELEGRHYAIDTGFIVFNDWTYPHFQRLLARLRVLTQPADQALALLEDPSPAEREILGALPYQDNEVVLHTDTRLLPRRRRAWASWNYRLDGRDEGQRISVTYPGCCTGSVRSPQMPGSVGIKGIWGGVWLFFDQVPVLRAHLPPPPCLFCAGDSTPRRYPGTSLLANIRKRSCSGYWLFNISRMVRVLRVMTAPIFSSFRRMVLTWAWAKAVRLR